MVRHEGDAGPQHLRILKARGNSMELRLISSNPDYAAYTCLAEEAHIVGKVLWKFTRA